MINLELYRIFAVVAKEENLTRASKLLNISQPAVTKHIKNLEHELGVTLFKRSKYGMNLTQEGQVIFDNILEPITILGNIETKIKTIKNINLGVHITMLSRMFSKVIGKYYEYNKDSKINIINENLDEMILRLEKQELDILVSKKVNSELVKNISKKIQFIHLGYLHDIFVVNHNSELLNKIVTKEDLQNEIIYTPRKSSITTINLMKLLNSKEENTNIRNMTYTTMLGIIQNGDGVGIIAKEYVKDEMAMNKISVLNTNFELEPIEFGIYLNKENRYRELNDFMKIIKEETNKI